MWLYHRVMSPNNADGMANSVDRVMSPNDAEGMANSVDPDQTAPLGTI